MFTQSIGRFHIKGYTFKKDDVYKAIVGSFNLTMDAMTINIAHQTNVLNIFFEKSNSYGESCDRVKALVSCSKIRCKIVI